MSNNSITPFLYFLKLTKSNNVVNLPYPLANARNCKITFCKFTTLNSGGDIATIKINGFNENVYFDGQTIHKCVKTLPLPSDNGSTLVYENQYHDKPDVAITNQVNEGLTTLRIEVLLNLQYSNDISSSNPFYLELKFW